MDADGNPVAVEVVTQGKDCRRFDEEGRKWRCDAVQVKPVVRLKLEDSGARDQYIVGTPRFGSTSRAITFELEDGAPRCLNFTMEVLDSSDYMAAVEQEISACSSAVELGEVHPRDYTVTFEPTAGLELAEVRIREPPRSSLCKNDSTCVGPRFFENGLPKESLSCGSNTCEGELQFTAPLDSEDALEFELSWKGEGTDAVHDSVESVTYDELLHRDGQALRIDAAEPVPVYRDIELGPAADFDALWPAPQALCVRYPDEGGPPARLKGLDRGSCEADELACVAVEALEGGAGTRASCPIWEQGGRNRIVARAPSIYGQDYECELDEEGQCVEVRPYGSADGVLTLEVEPGKCGALSRTGVLKLTSRTADGGEPRTDYIWLDSRRSALEKKDSTLRARTRDRRERLWVFRDVLDAKGLSVKDKLRIGQGITYSNAGMCKRGVLEVEVQGEVRGGEVYDVELYSPHTDFWHSRRTLTLARGASGERLRTVPLDATTVQWRIFGFSLRAYGGVEIPLGLHGKYRQEFGAGGGKVNRFNYGVDPVYGIGISPEFRLLGRGAESLFRYSIPIGLEFVDYDGWTLREDGVERVRELRTRLVLMAGYRFGPWKRVGAEAGFGWFGEFQPVGKPLDPIFLRGVLARGLVTWDLWPRYYDRVRLFGGASIMLNSYTFYQVEAEGQDSTGVLTGFPYRGQLTLGVVVNLR